jgi:ribosomal RNA assembly protein
MPRREEEEEEAAAETAVAAPTPSSGKTGKFRKEKPWDVDGIDHWCVASSVAPRLSAGGPLTAGFWGLRKLEKFSREDNPGGLLEESSFATLFPKYQGAPRGAGVEDASASET